MPCVPGATTVPDTRLKRRGSPRGPLRGVMEGQKRGKGNVVPGGPADMTRLRSEFRDKDKGTVYSGKPSTST